MSSEDIQELHEHAEEAKHDPGMLPVSLTMAILAVIVATASLLGHRTHTKEVVLQNEVTDGWAYYQAKNVRLHIDQMFVDLTSFATSRDNDKTDKLREKYQAEAKKYTDEKKEAEAHTRKLEGQTQLEEKRADLYDLGEVFLEVALVITSITLLSRRRAYWYGGMIVGVAGAVLVAKGFLM